MKIRNILFLSGLLLITSALATCSFTWGEKTIKGNGNIITKTFDIGQFEDVNTSGRFELVLTQSEESKVIVETDENLFPYLKVEVNGDKLVIGKKTKYNLLPSKRIIAKVSSNTFHNIRLEGSGEVVTTNTLTSDEAINVSISGSGGVKANIESKESKLRISGSGDIVCKGKTERLDIKISGSGNIECEDFHAEDVKINISGSGDAIISANGDIKARISGSGGIVYYGNPKNIDMSVSGSGSVKKKSKSL